MQSFLGKRKKIDYIILLLIGLLLLVIVFPTSSKEKSNYNLGGYTKEDATNLEKRLQNILEQMEGVGKTTVMITFEDNQKTVKGVVVVAKGAGQPSVCKKISDVVMSLFDIEAHKIRIVKMVSEE